MQQELTPARLAGFPSLLRKLFKSYLQHMAFLSLPQVANVLPQQYSLMLERHPNKHHLTVAGHVFRVCTMKRIYLGSRNFRLGSFRVPSAMERSINRLCLVVVIEWLCQPLLTCRMHSGEASNNDVVSEIHQF